MVTAATGEAFVTETNAAPALDGAKEKDTKEERARVRNTRKITNQILKALLSRDLHFTVYCSST